MGERTQALLIFLVVMPILAVAIRVLFGNRDVITDQREMAVRRANWKGTNGPAARQAEVARVRGNWLGLQAFGAAMVVLAVGAVVWAWAVSR